MYKLSMVSETVLNKIRGTSRISILLEVNKQKKGKLDELGRSVVPGALNDTETIRKVGADIFANVGLEKP